MTGIEKIGLVMMIMAAPYVASSDGWKNGIFTMFVLVGAILFVIPQRKP